MLCERQNRLHKSNAYLYLNTHKLLFQIQWLTRGIFYGGRREGSGEYSLVTFFIWFSLQVKFNS